MLEQIRDRIAKAIGAEVGGLYKVRVTLDKYAEDITPYRGREHEFYARFRPYETRKFERNALLNEGINAIWTLVCGGAGTAYSNANARIGVGDSDDEFDATDTDLQAAVNKTYKAMDVGYPVYGTDQKASFKASFGTDDANFAWKEWTVDNGSGAGKNLNRKVEALGTKTSGTWALTVELSLS
jgi:hypothetical protein